MSVIAEQWVRNLSHTHPDLEMTQGEFNVLALLAHKQNPYTGKCQLSESEIGRGTRLSERHVRRSLNAHCRSGALRWIEKGKSKSWASCFEFGLGFVFVALSKREPRTSCRATPDILSQNPGHPVAPYKERNQYKPESLDPPQNHHSFAALISAWLSIKAELKNRLPAEEWDLWVRPLYLLKARPSDQFVLFALPANNRMAEAARANRAILIEMLAPHGYRACGFQFYPDDYQLGRMQSEFPELYEELPDALKKRRPERALA
jgi:hypothetical protein